MLSFMIVHVSFTVAAMVHLLDTSKKNVWASLKTYEFSCAASMNDFLTSSFYRTTFFVIMEKCLVS